MATIENHKLLSDALIQQVENDVTDGIFDALHDVFERLISDNDLNKKILLDYMTDSIKEDLIEGRIEPKMNVVS